MIEENKIDIPLVQVVSFNKLLEQYDVMPQSDDDFLSKKTKRILKFEAPCPELREGFLSVL